ncbi:unnamed protein product [Phytomonas sp. EM1]|nr:unnamed protein product [Phytomonas sp. EM1]|eukprot:CCW65141.1 unnamed protein product [Phytomonas sp. isolate EM1]
MLESPSPMRESFIDPPTTITRFNQNHRPISLRRRIDGATDVAMRPVEGFGAIHEAEIARETNPPPLPPRSYGERGLEDLSCRWAQKFYGQVTFAPRNYPYPSSRWLARRFHMKKHRILKRFRFRRYKLAAVANLPFAKMIRVGMLPELKSSKTKKADIVEGRLSEQLVKAAKSSKGGKTVGKRTRPKSKYQV